MLPAYDVAADLKFENSNSAPNVTGREEINHAPMKTMKESGSSPGQI